MTRDERKRLRELCEAATPGPWTWWTSCSFRRLSSGATGRDGDVLHGAKHHDGVCDVVGRDEDRAFIAEARTALPALLDALDRVDALAEEWVTCDGVVMEDGEVVGPSPMVAKTLRHCADGVRAALRRALEGGTR